MFGRKDKSYYRTHMTDEEIASAVEKKKSEERGFVKSFDDVVEQSFDIATAD